MSPLARSASPLVVVTALFSASSVGNVDQSSAGGVTLRRGSQRFGATCSVNMTRSAPARS